MRYSSVFKPLKDPYFLVVRSLAQQLSSQISNFYKAYSLLTFSSRSLVTSSILAASALQSAIVEAGRPLLQTNLSHKQIFKYSMFSIGEKDIFRRPCVLKRLATWVMETRFKHVIKTGHTALPQLLIAQDELKGTYLCAGVIPCHHPGERNIFASLFYRASEECKGKVQVNFDFWDKTVVEVGAKNWNEFMSSLKQEVEGA